MKEIDVYSIPTLDLTWNEEDKYKMKDHVKESDLRSRYVVIEWHDKESISSLFNVHLPYFISIKDTTESRYTNNTIWLCGLNGRIFITDRNMALYYGKKYKGAEVTKNFRITFDKKLIGKKINLVTFNKEADGLEYTGIYLNGKIYVYKEDLWSNDIIPNIEGILLSKTTKYKLDKNTLEECTLKPRNFEDNGLSCLYTSYIKGKTHFFRETEDAVDLDEKYYLQMALAMSNEKYIGFCVNEFNYKTLCEKQDTDVYLYSNGMLLVKTP